MTLPLFYFLIARIRHFCYNMVNEVMLCLPVFPEWTRI